MNYSFFKPPPGFSDEVEPSHGNGLFIWVGGAIRRNELSKFNGDVIKHVNNAKECLYLGLERDSYKQKLIHLDDLINFYSNCFLAIVHDYKKEYLSGAAASALNYVQLTNKRILNKDLLGCCIKIEKCLENYGEWIKKSKKVSWFHMDILLANIIDFSESVIRETADDGLKHELQGLLFRVRHMRVLLPQKVPWDERILDMHREAAENGIKSQPDVSERLTEDAIFKLVYASRRTFPQNKGRSVALYPEALLNILRTPQLRDFWTLCCDIISAKSGFKDFKEKAEALLTAMNLDDGQKSNCRKMVFPDKASKAFLASDYSCSLFFFEHVLGGFVQFLNEYYKKCEDEKLRREIRTFRLILLALIVLHTFKGMPKK